METYSALFRIRRGVREWNIVSPILIALVLLLLLQGYVLLVQDEVAHALLQTSFERESVLMQFSEEGNWLSASASGESVDGNQSAIADGAITITFGQDSVIGLRGRSLTQRPSFAAMEQPTAVRWTCKTPPPLSGIVTLGEDRTTVSDFFLGLICR